MNEFETLWSKVLESLQDEIDAHIFDTFFRDSYIYAIKGNKIYVATSSELAAKIISQKYSTLLDTLTHSITQTNYELLFFKEDVLKNDKNISKKDDKTFFKDSKLNPKYTFDNFVVGTSNQEAKQAALIVACSPGTMYNPLFIYSDSGLGKTHLLHSVGNYIKDNNPRKNILISSTSSFIDEYINGARGEKDLNSLKSYIKTFDVLLIDDIQGLVDHKKTEAYFFDIFNYFVDNEKQIVITCDKLPSELKGIESRLVTRFSQGLLTKISAPSIDTSIEILKNKITQNGLNIANFDEDALKFIAENKSNSVRELEGALNKLLSYTINFKPTTHVDLKTTIEALQDILNIKDVNTELSEKRIINTVASYYGLTSSQILGQSRIKAIANARHISMYLIRNILNTPYTKIGKIFGGKDHSTVMSSINRVDKLCKTDKITNKVIHDLKTMIG